MRHERSRHLAFIPQSPASALNPVRRVGSVLNEIARTLALLGAPELVIADEPTSGLDAELVDATAAQLERIASSGRRCS